MRINQITLNEDNNPCWDGHKRVPGTKKYEPGSCERVEEDLNEFTSGGGDQGGNYFQALASAWYNGTFDSGSLQKGIKSQEDVERLLQRGVVCPDSVTRKYSIDYNSDFDGVIISSDDYYEHADHDETDSRTGKPFGPYDYMEFSDDELDESVNEDWNKVNKRDKTSGMSRKAVKAYRRENPGSKLQTAVTTKPSKLKKGSKAAKRRKSFCARMSGNKGPMKKPNGKPTPKALALRRWNCESVEEMEKLVMIAEQKISEAKNLKQQAAIAISKKKKQDVVENTDQWYTVMRGNLDFNKKYHGKGDDVTGPLSKVQANADLRKTHPYDTNWTMIPGSSMQEQMHEAKSSPQAILARKALDRGSKKMPGMSNIVQQLVREIKPDGTVVVNNSAEIRTMNNIKKILELGGGKNFDVVMAPPGPGWQSAKSVPVPVPVPDKETDKKEVAEVKDDEDDGLIGGRYTPEQWAKMIANLKRKAQEQDAKKKQQERPKDLGESTDELNNILKLSGNIK
jgi:hypothetical protein